MARLTRGDILKGWQRLGDLARAEGKSIDLKVVGGAVMAVHFRSRDATADVDGLFEPVTETREWAKTVAEEMGWPDDWLNDGAKGYVCRDSDGPVIFQAPGITVQTLSLPHLLALKLMAWRDQIDIDDALRILKEIQLASDGGVSTAGELQTLLDDFLVPTRKTAAQYAVEELWELWLSEQ